jgi:hypothetical protein
VLGVGRVLLHDTVTNAMAAHAISSTEHPDAVAGFGAPDGSRIWLVRGGAERPASLDEVVLGYLASGRSTAAAA